MRTETSLTLPLPSALVPPSCTHTPTVPQPISHHGLQTAAAPPSWLGLSPLLVQEPSSGSPPPPSSHSLLTAARAVLLKHESHHDGPSRPTGCHLNGLSIIPAPPAGLPAALPLRLHSRHQTLLIFTPLCICSCSSLHRMTFCLQSCFFLLNVQLNAPSLCEPFLIPLLQIPEHISPDLLIAAPFAESFVILLGW